MKAVVDRIEGNYAVVLFGDEEIQADIQKNYCPRGLRRVAGFG